MTIEKTLQERGQQYGEFKHQALISQSLKTAMRATPKWDHLRTDQKEALEMIANKIGRILNGNIFYYDNWHDIVGYAKLVADTLENQQTTSS